MHIGTWILDIVDGYSLCRAYQASADNSHGSKYKKVLDYENQSIALTYHSLDDAIMPRCQTTKKQLTVECPVNSHLTALRAIHFEPPRGLPPV